MKIGIVGWGIEGQSVYNYFGPSHGYLIVNEEPRDDFPAEAPNIKVQFNPSARPAGTTGNATNLNYLAGLDHCDKIVYTPTSVKNLENYFGDDKSFWDKTTTSRHIFFETVKTKNIIGVTGTKGKGTTSTLIAKMLEASGQKVWLAGNIGKAVLDFVNEVQETDWVVLELSSFQLYKFPYSPHIAICLMISPEHLDWHQDFYEYTDSKSSLFRNQKPDDIAIYFAEDEFSQQVAGESPGIKIPYFDSPGARVKNNAVIVIGEDETEIIQTKLLKLVGEHNWQNICAAVTAVWQVDQNIEAIKQVLTTFSGLEHRLEFVRELDGVQYYDDSFGTTPETAIVAIKAFVQPKILILGGSDKGVEFDKLTDTVVEQRVSQVIAIGQTGPDIAELLRQKGFKNITTDLKNMTEVVAAAKRLAKPGDVVLLSTGCASFGMFKDYKDRGDQFKTAVRALS